MEVKAGTQIGKEPEGRDDGKAIEKLLLSYWLAPSAF